MLKNTVTSDKWLVTSKIRRVAFLLSLVTLHSSLLFGQQPQAQAGQALFPVNAKYVQGFGPGYWPTAGSNLTLNLAPGTAFCSNAVQTYAGGTLTLAPSATNYVYLNTANNCTPTSNTTGFTSATIPIATVVTASNAISSITDVRTMFVSSPPGGSGSVTNVGMTGDGIIFNSAVSGSPITLSGTLAPQLLTHTANTVLAGPSTGSPATPAFRALSAADLPASITSSTSGNAATATALASNPSQCGSNNWATGISTYGNANCLQPGFSNLSGSATISQGGTGQTTAAAAFNALSPLTAEGDLHYYHSASNSRLPIGSMNTFLTSNGTDPYWGSLTGAGFGSQPANCFFAAPNGSSGNMSCRAILAADVPTLNQNTTGNAATATALAATPSQCSGNNFAAGIGATGNANCAQPAFSNLGGSATVSQLPGSGATTINGQVCTLSSTCNVNNGAPQYSVAVNGAAGAVLGGVSPSPTAGVPLISQGASSSPSFGTVALSGGGTGQTTAAAAFNALSPLTTEGDLHYYHTGSNARMGIGSSGQCLTSNGTDPVWGSCSTGSGTVTSVGLSMPSIFSVSNSPVTGSGTLTAALANQNANLFMAGPPSGNAAAPTFRALVGADLPAPSASTLGGVESMTCTGGQFLNQISTVGLPACATPSGGGSSGLGNGSTVIDASLQAGVDFSAKVNAAFTALPSTGGVVDARGLGGSQSMSANILMPPNVTLFLGAVAITESAGVGIRLSYGDAIVGLSPQSTTIAGNGTSPMIYQDTTVNASYLTLVNFTVGNYINAINNPPHYPLPNDMAIYLPQASNSTFVNLNAYASYGFYYGSKTGFRPDLPYLTGCNCYSHFQGNNFLGWITGLTVGWNANSNGYYDNVFGGLQSGTAVYIDTGAFSNYFWHSDEEVQNLGFDIYGQDTVLDSTYIEAPGLRADAPSWTAGYAYIAGEIIRDSNGNEQKCVVSGASGSFAPVWATAAGARTTDNGATWQRVVNATGVFEASSNNTVISGGGHLSSTLFDNFTSSIPMFVTHTQAQFPVLCSGTLNSSNGQVLSGGVNTGVITLSGPPALSYHLAGGTHTTSYYYYVNLNTGVSASGTALGQTGLSPQATLSNAPDVLGQVMTAGVANGGSGYAVNDTITLNCYTTGTTPVLKVSSVSSGVVTGVTITNGGTYIAPGTCGQASTSGSGTGSQSAVDSNYIVITPPTVNIPGVGTTVYQYPGGGSWDIVGRSNVTNVIIGSYGQGTSLTPNSFCPSAGTFCDLGWPSVLYNTPARNTTGDFTVGASNGGATISHLLNNYFDTFANPSTGTPAYFAYQFTPHVAAGNGSMDFLVTPEGTGNESSYCLGYNSDAAAAHTFCTTATSTGLTIGGLSGNNLPVYIPALVVPTPMTTLGDVIAGGASGAPSRVAGPTGPNGVPQILTSTPSGGAAQAPGWGLAAVPLNNNGETTCSGNTLNALDRAAGIFCSGGSAATFTLPVHTTSGFGVGFPFFIFNGNSGNLTLSPTTDTIDNATVYPKWASYIYNNPSGNWQSINIPTIGALQGTDSKLMSAGTISGTGATLCTDATGGATTSGCTTGTSVSVNGSSVSNPNFNGTTPAAGSGYVNLTWQYSGSSVTGEINPALLGVIDAIGSGGSSQTISPANGQVQTITLNSNLTVSFTQPSSGAAIVRLGLTQAASGGPYTVSWTSVKWPGGVAPVMSIGASQVDWYSCLLDGTNTWCTAAQNMQ